MSVVNMLGIMVISNINDHAAGGVDEQGCCPDCCAPCGVTRDLLDDGDLDYHLRAGVSDIGGGWEWWNDETGTVDADWLRSRWKCQANPACEEVPHG